MREIICACLILIVSGCAHTSIGPSVPVMPGSGKSFKMFKGDNEDCRSWSNKQVEALEKYPIAAQEQYNIAYQQCMYTKGNLIKATIATDFQIGDGNKIFNIQPPLAPQVTTQSIPNGVKQLMQYKPPSPVINNNIQVVNNPYQPTPQIKVNGVRKATPYPGNQISSSPW